LIFDKPDLKCGWCLEHLDCDCICHKEDMTDNKHYHITRDDAIYKVKPVVDLDHFRDV